MDLEALKNELIHISSLLEAPIAQSTTVAAANCPQLTFIEAARILITSPDPLLTATGYWALAICHNKTDSVTLSDGRSFSQIQLFFEALKYNPQFSDIYNDLGSLLDGDDVMELPGGREMTKKQLRIEALRFTSSGPISAQYYFNLGCSMDNEEHVSLYDGREMTRKQILLESLKYPEQRLSWYYIALSETLSPSETVTIDGSELNSQQLCIQAIRVDPKDYSAYNALAFTLRQAETATLADGRTMGFRELLCESLLYNPQDTTALYFLSRELDFTETVTLRDGRSMRARDLLMEALRYKQDEASIYSALANQLEFDETVVIEGRSFQVQTLYIEALKYEIHPTIMRNLADTLLHTPEASVTLHDGRTLRSHELFMEAQRLDPDSEEGFRELCMAMPLLEGWTRMTHAVAFKEETNVLFATLLLAVLRLEAAGTLLSAHYSMLEDMLECWTWQDARDLGTDSEPQ